MDDKELERRPGFEKRLTEADIRFRYHNGIYEILRPYYLYVYPKLIIPACRSYYLGKKVWHLHCFVFPIYLKDFSKEMLIEILKIDGVFNDRVRCCIVPDMQNTIICKSFMEDNMAPKYMKEVIEELFLYADKVYRLASNLKEIKNIHNLRIKTSKKMGILNKKLEAKSFEFFSF